MVLVALQKKNGLRSKVRVRVRVGVRVRVIE